MSWSISFAICSKWRSLKPYPIPYIKYAGVSLEDLVEIYILFIRSLTEYCAVAFHSSLTEEDNRKLEQIQKTCLKVILGEMYVNYTAALEMCGLQLLSTRRQKRCLDFAQKCLKNQNTSRLFPREIIQDSDQHYIRDRDKFEVHFANGDTYETSAIPFCQRLLNEHHRKKRFG